MNLRKMSVDLTASFPVPLSTDDESCQWTLSPSSAHVIITTPRACPFHVQLPLRVLLSSDAKALAHMNFILPKQDLEVCLTKIEFLLHRLWANVTFVIDYGILEYSSAG
jgi:hypothetical protein